MSIIDTLRTGLANWLFPADVSPARRAQLDKLAQLSNYISGRQRRQLTVKPLQADDNLILNFCGLVVDRSVSMLFGKPIRFDLPGDDGSPQAEYIDSTWAANKQGILLHRVGYLASVYGTGFVKILPESITRGGAAYARLVPVHPAWVEIVPSPEDADEVQKYVIYYRFVQDGREYARRETTLRIYAHALNEAGQVYQTKETESWTVTSELQMPNGAWVQESVTEWPYTFAPIVHWQNLPNGESCYGKSDIEDVIESQDRLNFLMSNISKIVRYHAHPKTWARGMGASQRASWGADEMVILNSEHGQVSNLEMQSDLSSSRAFALDVRQALFDITRTVDMTSIADKIGSLTNFGLRVLYMDALNKNATKQLLYGDALTEINRRLLILNGAGDDADGGAVIWPETLPVNEIEQTQALTADANLGLVSRQTAAGERGYDWDTEQERLAGEQASGDNVGAAILRAFSQGG